MKPDETDSTTPLQRRKFTRPSLKACYLFPRMKHHLLWTALTASAFLLPAVPGSAAAASKEPVGTPAKRDYVRYVGDDKRGKLQTVIVTMKKGDQSVELVGAVHVADPEYYKTLTKLFAGYEELLFELVDGQRLKDGIELKSNPDKPASQTAAGPADENPGPAEEEDRNPAFKIISGMMHGFGNYFQLQYQTDGIDYHTSNFVHADVSMDEFVRMQADKGESFTDLIRKAMEAQLQVGRDRTAEPKGSQLLLALLGDSSGLKVAMARQLAAADELVGAMEQDGGSVIITERNKKALEVLDRETAAGRKNLGLFYGAAHLSDIEGRLEKKGYHRTGERWVTAWDIKPRVDQIHPPTPATP
jgi:hypothetical protein